MSNPVFWENKEKISIFFFFSSTELAQRVLNVNALFEEVFLVALCRKKVFFFPFLLWYLGKAVL